MVCHVDKYKITFKLVISWRYSGTVLLCWRYSGTVLLCWRYSGTVLLCWRYSGTVLLCGNIQVRICVTIFRYGFVVKGHGMHTATGVLQWGLAHSCNHTGLLFPRCAVCGTSRRDAKYAGIEWPWHFNSWPLCIGTDKRQNSYVGTCEVFVIAAVTWRT